VLPPPVPWPDAPPFDPDPPREVVGADGVESSSVAFPPGASLGVVAFRSGVPSGADEPFPSDSGTPPVVFRVVAFESDSGVPAPVVGPALEVSNWTSVVSLSTTPSGP
jgi:hypothetical protein